ncbi:MAG: hypothetical protein PVI11_01040 [Candidatus Aminicenantes bacterium]
MRKPLVFSLIAMLFLPSLNAQDDELLEINALISPRRLSKGQEGKVVLKFKIKEGIKINPQPSFTIELSPTEDLVFSKNFFTAYDLEIEIVEEDGKKFLDLSEQIEVPFIVNEKAARGLHALEGKVKYFAFSKAENWCLKTTMKFSTFFYMRDLSPEK